jgi:hypothetical protein
MPMATTNRELYDLILDGVRVEFRDADGRNRIEQVRMIDFKDAETNEFLAVTQMWIQGEVLDKTLPDSHDRDLFAKKCDSEFELVLELAVDGVKWAA